MFYADNIINSKCLYLNVMEGKAYKTQHGQFFYGILQIYLCTSCPSSSSIKIVFTGVTAGQAVTHMTSLQ